MCVKCGGSHNSKRKREREGGVEEGREGGGEEEGEGGGGGEEGGEKGGGGEEEEKKHRQYTHYAGVITPQTTKGCEHYHNLIKGNNTFRNNTQCITPANTSTYGNISHHSINSQQQRSYTDVTKSNTNQVDDTTITLTKWLDEFKGLFNQLLQQNSMVLNMHTVLINKTN
jgi:hypothetical protein